MRTTIDIDDEVLEVIRALAAQKQVSLGRVLSSLLKSALSQPPGGGDYRNGIPLVPRSNKTSKTRSTPITPEAVKQMMDEEYEDILDRR